MSLFKSLAEPFALLSADLCVLYRSEASLQRSQYLQPLGDYFNTHCDTVYGRQHFRKAPPGGPNLNKRKTERQLSWKLVLRFETIAKVGASDYRSK